MNYVAYNYTLRENCIIPFANPHKGEYGEAFDNFMNYYDPYIFASHPDKKPKLTKKSEIVYLVNTRTAFQNILA
jgi:hypothetical protein